MRNPPGKDSSRRKRERAFQAKGVKVIRYLGSDKKFDGSGSLERRSKR